MENLHHSSFSTNAKCCKNVEIDVGRSNFDFDVVTLCVY